MKATGRGASRLTFLALRLPRTLLAEALHVVANLLPELLGAPLLGLVLKLNPEHKPAAIRRAEKTLEANRGAWDAFRSALQQAENPRGVSASDLYLSEVPGRLARALVTRALWGPARPDGVRLWSDKASTARCAKLAETHFHRALAAARHDRAAVALTAWCSLTGDSPRTQFAWAELAWARNASAEAVELLKPLIDSGSFPSPLDPVAWGDRLVEAGLLDPAARCLEWARRFTPELPRVWRNLGLLASHRGGNEDALRYWRRALALDPQDLKSFLEVQRRTNGQVLPELTSVELHLEAPAAIELGAHADVECAVEPAGPGWSVSVLPPAGWGVVPAAAETRLSETGQGRVSLEARRPDRICGEPWRVVFVAVSESGYVVASRSFEVPDSRPGRVLVTVTEDHEIHEERGRLEPELLRHLLVEKSRFAASLDGPWTHMVETGSSLAMTSWAAETGEPPWRRLQEEVRDHLAEEVARGNDIQPHLHAFNDPAYLHFPYSLSSGAWVPSLEFLLTPADQRGDWASACAPPGDGTATLDRLQSVERAVAQVESIGRLGDPDHRPVVWRSGLLDYGATREDCAWSTVALRRAGLWADSDLAKPGSPFRPVVSAAFPAGWETPFELEPGGPLLQLPVAANVEGDFVMGRRLLARRARRSVAAAKSDEGLPKPGVHLFTLLTHDKFLNARRGGDELCLDPGAGDWLTVRAHLDAWRRVGATVVTAADGVRQVLDDLTWHPLPWLRQETFVLAPAGPPEVRYELAILGAGIRASPQYPQHVLVPIPPSLRSSTDSIAARQGSTILPVEPETDAGAFWLTLESLQDPVSCQFILRHSPGPELAALEVLEENTWGLELTSDLRLLRARVLLPWGDALPRRTGTTWSAEEGPSGAVRCIEEPDGLVLFPLRFERLEDGSAHCRLRLQASGATAAGAVANRPEKVLDNQQ